MESIQQQEARGSSGALGFGSESGTSAFSATQSRSSRSSPFDMSSSSTVNSNNSRGTNMNQQQFRNQGAQGMDGSGFQYYGASAENGFSSAGMQGMDSHAYGGTYVAQMIYQGLISQGLSHPNEQIATTVEAKDGSALLQKGDSDELPNSQQVISSVQERAVERESEREANQLKNLIKLNKNCEQSLHLESLRNRRLFKIPQFTKRTRSH